jgi:hypothetical protein
MREADIEAIERQLEQLRKKTQFLTRLSVLLLVLPIFVVVAGFQPIGRQEIIESKEFVLKDKNGKVQAKLFTNDTGFPNLVFYDAKGGSRIEIGLQEMGASIVMADDNKDGLFSMLAKPDGVSHLEVAQPGGKRVTLISAKDDINYAEISMGDSDGKNELAMGVVPGDSYITLLGKAPGEKDGDEEGVFLRAGLNGESQVIVKSKDGKEQLLIRGGADGKAFIEILGALKKSLFRVPPP